jgi:hypothetical protein
VQLNWDCAVGATTTREPSYFGMKPGFIPKGHAPDELIAGTELGAR